jgi:hypothetical protein
VLPKPEHSSSTAMTAADRRSESRHPTEGVLHFYFDDPARQDISGRLMDHSKSGFRAMHNYTALHTGQIVEFRHMMAFGKARVMWNRIADDRVETGFLVIK